MTAQSDQPFEIAELRDFLIEGRLLESGPIHLTEYEPAFPRQHDLRRWHYQVRLGKKNPCHLIVGLKLANVYERAKGLSTACPELTCPPLLFRERKDGMGFLFFEHFQGESLDSLIAQGRCSSVLWLEYVRRAQKLLESSQQNSTAERLTEEVTLLIEQACDYPGFSDFDRQFMRGPAQAAILSGALSTPILRRWTNGDFVGRNLLVDPEGNLRLVDYEYAELTHFGEADWLRLLEFSTLPPDFDESSIPEAKAARQPWAEVRMWVHHLAQLKSAHPSEAVMQHRIEAVGRLVRSIAGTSTPDVPSKADSLLIRLLAQQQLQTQSLVDQRSSWAKSLESELQAARENFKQLLDEHLKRSAWAKSLEAELHSARERFEQLASEHEQRTAWANSLDAELQTTRGHFEKLTQEFKERTAWALSLDSELQATRSAHQEQSQIIATLCAERDRLKAERTALDQVTAKLEADLSSVRKHYDALTVQVSAKLEQAAITRLEHSSLITADHNREVAVKNADADHLAALLLEAKLRTDSSESEAARLAAALKDAQIHIDGLIARTVTLQALNNELTGDKIKTERKLGQSNQRLVSITERLETSEGELARYKHSLICRWAARSAPRKPPAFPPSHP